MYCTSLLLLRVASEPDVPDIEIYPVDSIEGQEEKRGENQEESDKDKNGKITKIISKKYGKKLSENISIISDA